MNSKQRYYVPYCCQNNRCRCPALLSKEVILLIVAGYPLVVFGSDRPWEQSKGSYPGCGVRGIPTFWQQTFLIDIAQEVVLCHFCETLQRGVTQAMWSAAPPRSESSLFRWLLQNHAVVLDSCQTGVTKERWYTWSTHHGVKRNINI